MKDIRPSGRLQRCCNVREIEQAQDIVLDVHPGGIEAKRKIPTQRSQLPVLLDLRQNRTDAVGIAGGVAIVELVLSEQKPS